MTMITPSYLGETIEYSSLHACRSTLEDPTGLVENLVNGAPLGHAKGSSAGAAGLHDQECISRSTTHGPRD